MLIASSANADVVLADVLDQLAKNFLLNDLSPEQSGKLLEATRTDVVFQLPRREPRRRNKVIGRVHQSRRSVRRIRSVLQTFPGLFDAEWSNPILVELSWFGGVLGESRDLDVLRAGIVKSLWMVEDEHVQAHLVQQLDGRIEASHEHVAVERATKRYALLVDEIATIGAAAVFDTRAKGPADEVLLGQLKGAWRDVEKARDVAKDDASNENLHELRKELKRLECSCEVLGLVVGKVALALAQSANTAQQQLGVVHDEAVARAWLKSLSVVEPTLKEPLGEIRAFHKAARRDAKRGWKASIDAVEESWDELRAVARS
ncbi:MAG: CHAD domain-containing protein [Acidimicrobiales bacterium]